jgi:catechol 2,3-dioxygenase-like lactoylglutathione lyase family enzyme
VSRLLAHVSLQASDLAASRRFYETVLAALGASLVMDVDGAFGFGRDGVPEFWVGAAVDPPGRETHVAFSAVDRASVEAFHAAAVGLGAESLHGPRLFPEYYEHYYGAFVRDPDGNNVEAVCLAPEPH